MIDQVYAGRDLLYKNQLDEFGMLLNEAWLKKKELSYGISDPELDGLYTFALMNGAIGGKILGAGGGGYFLFYCPKQDQKKLKKELEKKGLKEFPFKFVDKGSHIVHQS
jgi:D-glycero-alpha-D-manno-heptose-7-phosphate kinase